MKRNGFNVSLACGLLAPSLITLTFLLIFGCLSFFWLMGQKTTAEVVIALSMLSAMIIISLGAAIYALKLVRAPMNEAVEAIKDISKGNLARRMKAGMTDGFGDMEKGFNALMDSYQKDIAKVSHSCIQISFESNTLDTTGKFMARGVEAIVKEVTSVAAASEEMASTSNEIARNCAVAAGSSDMVSQSARTGEGIILGIVAAMTRIGEKVKGSAHIMKGLGARSEQIGEIAAIINEIADQTNLLALNAAIEAARAGEHGRGFAVVADEVKKLAERTAGATKDIGVTIEAMQAETRSALAAMEEGVKEVESGAEETEKSGDALKEILRQVETLASQINQIAVASEQQTATTNEITGNIQKISEVMSGASDNIGRNSEASSRIAGLTLEINALLKKYAHQVQEGGKASRNQEDAMALVRKAADYLKTHGKENAIRELSNRNGIFVKGDLYVFAQKTDGTMMANAPNPQLVGSNVTNLRDVDGKYFGREIIDTGKKGSGWVDYNWKNPTTGEVVAKSSYVLGADDGIILGCGIYR